MSSLYRERLLKDVARELIDAKDRGRGAVMFIGAGCSKSGGIPLAGEICEHIRTTFPDDYAYAEREGDTGYQALMAVLSEAERRRLLSQYIDAAKVNWAHIALATLIKEGYVARVLTPNFDPLLIRACALINEFPAVYDFAASQTFESSYVHTPAIFYLHGQRTGFRLLNTADEVGPHARRLAPMFDEAGIDRPWVVVGYSGANDPVYEKLLATRHYTHRFFWVGHGDADPGLHLTDFLQKAGASIYLVRGYDADTFFVRLADELGCFPPALVARPFEHLLEALDMVMPYTLSIPLIGESDKEIDLLEEARAMAQEAGERAATPSDDTDRTERALTEARTHLMSGDYEAVLALHHERPDASPELTDLAAWALISQGIELVKRARRSDDEAETDRLSNEAEGKYEAALAIKPDKDEALNNWGNVLSERGKRAGDPAEADRLFREAEGKYEAALAIKPDKHEALNNWGTVLLERGKRAGDPAEADRLFREAEGKCEAALAIKPDSQKSLNSWGLILSERAKRAGDPAEAIRLFNESEKPLREAARLNPLEVYNLACLYALRGDEEQARSYLFQAKEAGSLPDRAHLLADSDLTSVRETPWFAALLEGIA